MNARPAASGFVIDLNIARRSIKVRKGSIGFGYGFIAPYFYGVLLRADSIAVETRIQQERNTGETLARSEYWDIILFGVSSIGAARDTHAKAACNTSKALEPGESGVGNYENEKNSYDRNCVTRSGSDCATRLR